MRKEASALKDEESNPALTAESLLLERISLAEKLLLNETSLRRYVRVEDTDKINEILEDDSSIISEIDIINDRLKAVLCAVSGPGKASAASRTLGKKINALNRKYYDIIRNLKDERGLINADLDSRLASLTDSFKELESISRIRKKLSGSLFQ